MSDALKRFRIVALSEGVSYVVLVFVAMPLKYLADQPTLNEIVGWMHGFLFIAYLVLGIQVAVDEEWSGKFIGGALVAALIPGGTFVLDRYLRPEANSSTAGNSNDR